MSSYGTALVNHELWTLQLSPLYRPEEGMKKVVEIHISLFLDFVKFFMSSSGRNKGRNHESFMTDEGCDPTFAAAAVDVGRDVFLARKKAKSSDAGPSPRSVSRQLSEATPSAASYRQSLRATYIT